MTYLLDTHTWIWLHWQPSRLSQACTRILRRNATSNDLLLSSISILEYGMLLSKGRLRLDYPLEEWIRSSTVEAGIRIIPASADIALAAVATPEMHYDIADRIIAATAGVTGATLLTADERLLENPHIRTLW